MGRGTGKSRRSTADTSTSGVGRQLDRLSFRDPRPLRDIIREFQENTPGRNEVSDGRFFDPDPILPEQARRELTRRLNHNQRPRKSVGLKYGAPVTVFRTTDQAKRQARITDPIRAFVCAKRKLRRKMMILTGGRGRGKKRRYSWESLIRC